MGIGDYGQNEHKFWFPDIEDDSNGTDDNHVPLAGIPVGHVADVPETSIGDMMSPETTQRCPHTEVLATGGWCKCGALVKLVKHTAPVPAPKHPSGNNLAIGGESEANITEREVSPESPRCADTDPNKDCPCGGRKGMPDCMFPDSVKASVPSPVCSECGWYLTPEEKCPKCGRPAAAPTGTGEGSEPLYEFADSAVELAAKLRMENASLRSQLEGAKHAFQQAHMWKMENAKRADKAERDLATAREELAEVKEELQNVLDDWNAIVKASGSRTNGGAIGHVASLVRNLATAQARIARLERACRDAINIIPEQVPLGVSSALRILHAALAEPQSGSE